ncbi:unnamed protein product [Caenorhabditis bovis]|uniref:Lipase_GDSL domain-containing protein n=1 Tax=Caenorhabditis bovis TaxID=2654633 RepID=A0A8S1EZV8_9PELO|nr:unnamed protein product [Caenorhabditis bovis]
MRIGFALLLVSSICLAQPEESLFRGEFHDESPFSIDYEDNSHNLTDYASRRASDDEKIQGEEEVRRQDSYGSSDISEERDRDAVDQDHLKSITAMKEKKVKPIITVINKAFNDRKTFSCPRIKAELLTGTSVADISPEDIKIISAMGDALATGVGLWPNADIEFRGASFPIGGDSTIDGLVTIPNILREFSPKLVGVSHGMGADLPDHQLNVAKTGATTVDLPRQAKELVRRLKKLTEANYMKEWVMITIAIGTEELCYYCGLPSYEHIIKSINYLQIHVPKALVVLLGPVHVSSFHEQKANLLKNRCPCTQNQTESYMYDLMREWSKVWRSVQNYVQNGETSRPTFGMIAYPMVTITSRYPNGLFIRDKPLLNRRGHNYATKWLWNRMIGGDLYNLSSAILSQDNYFCPSVGCPYFRTYANAKLCRTTSYEEAAEMEMEISKNGRLIDKDNHGRFEYVDEQTRKLEDAQKEEQKAILTRQNTRAQSELLPTLNPVQSVARHKSFRGTIEEEEKLPV